MNASFPPSSKSNVKRALLAFSLLLCMCAGCRHDDWVVAETHNKKLFASEVSALIPSGLNTQDSIDLAHKIIEDWITEQIILYEADKALSIKEKIFDSEITEYRKTLLKQRYFEHLTADASKFQVSDEEVRTAIRQMKVNLVPDKEIVKINYVKLPKGSPLLTELRGLLFDESRRQESKDSIALICGDSVEYFINDDQWLFWDDIQLETNIELNKNQHDFPLTYETSSGENSYLVVILDYKSSLSGEESDDYRESVRTMLIQQKKKDYIDKKIKELYQQADKKGKINR